MGSDYSKLSRPLYEMPEFVKNALEENNLMEDYLERPVYQQNDYLWWIKSAKKDETKKKRLKQMLKELETGGVYMKMDHPSSKKDDEN